MDRRERRYREFSKQQKRIKRYWKTYYHNGRFQQSAHSLTEAIEKKNEIYPIFNYFKNNHFYHRKNMSSYLDHRRFLHKEKVQSKKQLKKDTEDALDELSIYAFEYHCGSCDNYPGDNYGNEKSEYAFHECPYKKHNINIFSEYAKYCPYYNN